MLCRGSWNNNSNNCRSANRNRNNPDNTNNNNGFRVVCAPAHTVPRSVTVRTGGRSRSVVATSAAEETESRPGLVGAVDAAAERPGRGVVRRTRFAAGAKGNRVGGQVGVAVKAIR